MLMTYNGPLLIYYPKRFGAILERWTGPQDALIFAADLVVEDTLRGRTCSGWQCGNWDLQDGLRIRNVVTGSELSIHPNPGLFVDDLVPVGAGWKPNWSFASEVRSAMASDEVMTTWSRYTRNLSGFCGWRVLKLILEQRLRRQMRIRSTARFCLQFRWEIA